MTSIRSKTVVAAPVRPPQRRRQAAFTLLELLIAIAIIGVLAALIVGLTGRAGEQKVRSRAKAELAAITMAIENYKSKLGYYPLENPVNNDLPPLYYELTGERLADALTNTFGVAGTGNTENRTFYSGVRPAQVETMGNGAKLLVFNYRKNFHWNYDVSSPTNNPDGFDLWVNVDVGGKIITIGNWTE